VGGEKKKRTYRVECRLPGGGRTGIWKRGGEKNKIKKTGCIAQKGGGPGKEDKGRTVGEGHYRSKGPKKKKHNHFEKRGKKS